MLRLFAGRENIDKERFIYDRVREHGGETLVLVPDQYTLVDTPGHVDFSAEMERALSVLDAAIVVVSAAEGVQGHTEVILRLLQSRKIPTVIFVNKLDRTGADKAAVLKRLQEKLPGEVVDFSGRLAGGNMEESLAEEIAALDETLLEKYLEGEVSPELWQKTAAKQKSF